ncbi:MAG: aldehyde ferredoxin oxidoreductase N-terminal domain-containing protein [Desulfobacterales bacterium]
MKLLRANMTTKDISTEDLPADWQIVGGRGLSARILNKEVPPDTDPLGPAAKLVLAGGPLAGILAPSFGRASAGAKSPLTQGIKEANAGGPAMQQLDKLGYRAIIVEGAPEDGKLSVLSINKDGASLDDGSEYAGMKNYDLVKALVEKYGDGSTVICIGPAGERKYTGASIAFADKDGLPSRHAGRGGLGAVMGAKGLKAVVLNDKGAPKLEMADREAYNAALKQWAELVKNDPQAKGMSTNGTPGGVVFLRQMGSMPSKNYSNEQTDGFERLAGDHLGVLRKERGGRMDGCMPGCLVKCSIIHHGPDGEHITSALEYETLALLGTNIGISDPDVVGKFDKICDDLGLDTIETGSAMGVAASEGKMTFGDAESALALFDEIEKGTDFGNTLGNGVVATCKALGVERMPAFGGQAIPAHDPRATKTTGTTYATSPMGADHTAGLGYGNLATGIDYVKASKAAQLLIGAYDSLGLCMFAAPADPKSIELIQTMLGARYGREVSAEEVMALGTQTIKDELEFNAGSGFNANTFPEWTRKEALQPSFATYDVSDEDLAKIWDD